MVIHIRRQEIMCSIIAYMMNFQAVLVAAQYLCSVWNIPVISSYATPILYGSFYASILIGFLILFTTKWSTDRIIGFLFFLLSALLTWMISPESRKYIWTSFEDIVGNPTYSFWLCSFSLFLFSGCVNDVDMLKKALEKMAYVTIGLATVHYFVAVGQGTVPEYMTFSYNILFSVALLFALNTCCFSWKRAVLAISGMILIFIAGCRGALVGLLVSVLACFLFGEKSRNQKYAVIAIASVGLIIALFVDWYSMLESIASLLDSFGVSSRTIRMIMEESFLEDSGRGDLRNTVLSELDILGKGLYGDRIALNGTYVHNIFFELMFDYGILFGGILFVAWAGTVVRCVFKVSGVSKVLICALLSGGFVKMFLSGSFLNQEPAVFLLLGICLNCIYANKRALTHAEKPAQVNDR